MFIRPSLGSRTASQMVLTFLAVLFAFPLAAAVAISLQGRGLTNYVEVLTHPGFLQAIVNSAIISSVTIVAVYVMTLLAAYAFAHLKLRGSRLLFAAVLVPLMIPSIVLILPLFLITKNLGLFDNYASIIVPLTAIALPYTTLLMKQFLESTPEELLDAAMIDGASTFQALRYVAAPLARPIGVVVILYTFLVSWNEYLLPLAFVRSDSMRVITQAAQYFALTDVLVVDLGQLFASLIIVSLPIVVTYLLLQRRFEEGLTTGALK